MEIMLSPHHLANRSFNNSNMVWLIFGLASIQSAIQRYLILCCRFHKLLNMCRNRQGRASVCKGSRCKQILQFIQQEFIPAHKSICKIDGRFRGASRFLLTQESDGTRVALALKYKLPGGFLSGMANNVFVKDKIKENLETSLSNLKTLVESEG